MVEALIFIQERGCYHVGLKDCKSFVFTDEFLKLNIGGIKTSKKTRERTSDVEDLAHAVAKFFEGVQEDLNDLESDSGSHIIRGLRELGNQTFVGSTASMKIFEAEVKHLVTHLLKNRTSIIPYNLLCYLFSFFFFNPRNCKPSFFLDIGQKATIFSRHGTQEIGKISTVFRDPNDSLPSTFAAELRHDPSTNLHPSIFCMPLGIVGSILSYVDFKLNDDLIKIDRDPCGRLFSIEKQVRMSVFNRKATIELDVILGGRVVQYTEFQGRDSDKFLSSFNPCFITLEGGVASET
ncbi:villin [Striga asiatica]|uniref:Villin n=1 Tax=Striga asiatica TaxID=4170 RepID=A0A5A7RI31_STRAF|nr:villin [Striga asiatica]